MSKLLIAKEPFDSGWRFLGQMLSHRFRWLMAGVGHANRWVQLSLTLGPSKVDRGLRLRSSHYSRLHMSARIYSYVWVPLYSCTVLHRLMKLCMQIGLRSLDRHRIHCLFLLYNSLLISILTSVVVLIDVERKLFLRIYRPYIVHFSILYPPNRINLLPLTRIVTQQYLNPLSQPHIPKLRQSLANFLTIHFLLSYIDAISELQPLQLQTNRTDTKQIRIKLIVTLHFRRIQRI